MTSHSAQRDAKVVQGQGGRPALRAAGLLDDRQGAAKPLRGDLVVAHLESQDPEVRQRWAQLRVVRSETRRRDLERGLQRRACVLVVGEEVMDRPHARVVARELRMTGRIGGRERLEVAGAGALVVARAAQENRDALEHARHGGIVVAERLAPDRERPLEHRARPLGLAHIPEQ